MGNVEIGPLPVSCVRSGRKALGAGLILFAAIWGGLPSLFMIALIAAGDFKPWMLMWLLFPVIGLAVFVVGLSQIFKRIGITIDAREVRFSQHGLFAREGWTEPLSGYRGVMRFPVHHTRKYSVSTEYVVELNHEQPSKRVRLFSSYNAEDHERKWQEYAAWLSLPPLEGSPSVSIVYT